MGFNSNRLPASLQAMLVALFVVFTLFAALPHTPLMMLIECCAAGGVAVFFMNGGE